MISEGMCRSEVVRIYVVDMHILLHGQTPVHVGRSGRRWIRKYDSRGKTVGQESSWPKTGTRRRRTETSILPALATLLCTSMPGQATLMQSRPALSAILTKW